MQTDTLADRIEAELPQTQCGQCNFPGCRPYAEAIAAGEADINHCPPGGYATVQALARLLGREPKPVDPSNGQPKLLATVAWIDEEACIGCTRCIQACPVDAILGAAKQMHTVIQQECTGCELCLPPCPVDCIHMRAVPATEADLARLRPPLRPPHRDLRKAQHARERYEFRQFRLQRDLAERAEQRRRKKAELAKPTLAEKKAAIAAAIARVKQKKLARQAESRDGAPADKHP